MRMLIVREEILAACVLVHTQPHIKSVVSLGKLLDSIIEEQINRDVIENYKTQIVDNEATGTGFLVSFSEHKKNRQFHFCNTRCC